MTIVMRRDNVQRDLLAANVIQRRSFLRTSGVGLGAIALHSLISDQARAGDSEELSKLHPWSACPIIYPKPNGSSFFTCQVVHRTWRRSTINLYSIGWTDNRCPDRLRLASRSLNCRAELKVKDIWLGSNSTVKAASGSATTYIRRASLMICVSFDRWSPSESTTIQPHFLNTERRSVVGLPWVPGLPGLGQ